MKKMSIAFALSLMLSTQVSQAQEFNAGSQESVSADSGHAPMKTYDPPASATQEPHAPVAGPRINSDARITAEMSCADFIATEHADNEKDQQGAFVHLKTDVRDHISQLSMLMSPYFVRDQNGHIYQPALGFLVFSTSDYCRANPEARLMDAIHQSAKDLVALVNESNRNTEAEVRSSIPKGDH